MNPLRSIFFFSCLWITSVMQSQSLSVQILDKSTSEPIAFATIAFNEGNLGITSDENGLFKITEEMDYVEKIAISSLGYSKIILTTADLDPDKLNTIFLVPKIESLDQIIIQNVDYVKRAKLTATEIVERAINEIPNNLSESAFSQIGYYREYQTSQTNGIYNLNEGIFEQYDAGINTKFLTHPGNQSVAYSYYNNPDYRIWDQLKSSYDAPEKKIKGATINAYGGNELSILNTHNAIRRHDQQSFSFVYKMNKDFKTYHDFEKASVYKENGEYLVNINISSKREMVGFSYKAKGQIIISLKDLSIYSFKYRVFDQSQTPLFKLFIEYQKIDHLMFLKYISFHNKFQVQDGEPFQESSILFEKENFKLKIAFNKPVDKASLLKRNFEIKLFGRKIKVKDITIKDSMNVEVLLKKKRLEQYSMADISENIMIRMSQIRATNGLLIYKARYKPYFQLREFFVQETLPLKTKSIADKVIDKNQPLEKAFINPNSSLKNYIINSPLNNYNKEEK